MAEFSIQDAAFSGFRIVREHRGSLSIWAAVAFVVSFAFAAVIIELAGPAVTSLQMLSASGARDAATVLPLLTRLAPLYLIMTPASAVFYGVLCSAMNRVVLRPEERKLAYFAFGADELRQIALLSLGFVGFGAVYMVVVIAVVLLVTLLDPIIHAAPIAAAALAVCVSAGLMTWLAVRLSLASALTFERRRLTLFSSWALTRGRFWPIFGTYVLVLALGAVIFLLTWLVIVAVVALATQDVSAAFAPADLRSIRSYFTVAQLVQLVLQAGVSALIWPVILTPPAAILRQISMLDRAGTSGRGVV